MSFSLILLLILVIAMGVYSFVIVSLNNSLVQLDLLFLEFDISLGSLILISFLLGISITIFLELIFFSSRAKKMNDLRTQISENLSKLGKQHVDLKIQDLPLKQKSIDEVISTPYLNFDFSKQRIDKQAFEWLLTIPDQLNLRDHFSMLLDGEFDNPSEKRKVSHTLYRSSEEKKDLNKFSLKEIKSAISLKRFILKKY